MAGKRIQGENLLRKRYKILAITYFSPNMLILNIIVVMLRITPAAELRVGKKNGGNQRWPRQGNLTKRDGLSSTVKLAEHNDQEHGLLADFHTCNNTE